MSKDITYETVLKVIENTGVPYDSGFDTEEHMVASFKAGLMLASKMVRARGNIGFANMLAGEAGLLEEDSDG